MKGDKVTLPLMATLFLIGTGNSLALAQGRASALDPYAYIQAPTTAQRQQEFAEKSTKKKLFKVPGLGGGKKDEQAALPAPRPAAKPAAQAPAKVIISSSSPKLEDEPKKEKAAPVKTADASSDAGDDEGGFLDGIKQSTGGIAKSTKAIGSGFVNGGKSVGSKIASGFKSAGEKVKEGSAAAGGKLAEAGGKVKEGGSGVGEKVAGGFKAAGGAIAALPKKVGAGGDGAKKLAAAPVAGFAAIGHGIGKMNPFHKDAPATPAIAQKGAEKKTEVAGATKPVVPNNLVPEKKAPESEVANANDESEVNAEKVAETGAPAETKPEVAKAPEKKETVKPEPKQEVASKDGGLFKKLASAPMNATKAGLGKTKSGTKAGVGVLSAGMNKLNPFHHEKSADPAPLAIGSKPAVKADTPAEVKPAEAVPGPAAETTAEQVQTPSPDSSSTEGKLQVGERIDPSNGEIDGPDGKPIDKAPVADKEPVENPM